MVPKSHDPEKCIEASGRRPIPPEGYPQRRLLHGTLLFVRLPELRQALLLNAGNSSRPCRELVLECGPSTWTRRWRDP
jgi:hypothetical protein